MEKENLEIKVKPRKAWKALLLSLLALGLGQIYNGQIKKFLILWAFLILVPITFLFTNLLITFYGWIILAVFLIGLQLYAIVDACISAKMQKQYVLKKYNKSYFYVVFGIFFYVAVHLWAVSTEWWGIGSVRTFKITMESSEPSLQIGDNIVADMRAYKNTDPDYGDIVIFKMDNVNYIFRVVGKPNDTLSFKDNYLIINNKCVRNSFIKTKQIDNLQVNVYHERLPNGCVYQIYKHADIPNYETITIDSVIIPRDCYFLMGDNRDNAMDSRYLGFIRREQIIGKAVFILTGKSGRMNINLN